MRTILHLDMDAFYASVEQRDAPELRGRPISVGGLRSRGVVMAASYEARRYGVRSAMPVAQARRLCPDLICVPPRFAAYREASRRIHALFAEWTELIEPLALDEAYLDVTRATEGAVGGLDVARALKQAIRDSTGLTASAGVSFNKFLAKQASKAGKPDGLVEITAGQAEAFLASLPIAEFHGIGPRTAERLAALGLRCGADLRREGEARLVARLGRLGAHLHRLASAIDERLVSPSRTRRSTSVERTFSADLRSVADLRDALRDLADELAARLRTSGFRGRSVVLKLRTADFRTSTRRITVPRAPTEASELTRIALGLLEAARPPEQPVRLLGLGVAGAGSGDPRQLDIPIEDHPGHR